MLLPCTMFRSKRSLLEVEADMDKAHKWNMSPNKLNGASLFKLSPMRVSLHVARSSLRHTNCRFWVKCKESLLLPFYFIIFIRFVFLLFPAVSNQFFLRIKFGVFFTGNIHNRNRKDFDYNMLTCVFFFISIHFNYLIR